MGMASFGHAAGAVANDCGRRAVREFQRTLVELADRYAKAWQAAETATVRLDREFVPSEQRVHEAKAAEFLCWLERELPGIPEADEERERWRAKFRDAVRDFARESLLVPQRGIDLIFTQESFDASDSFLSRAASFDDTLEPAELSQALRNVWVMNALQVFLGREPSITPSVFAYSLLYPYTDNYLDQASVPGSAKDSFNRRLGLRLQGVRLAPESPREERIHRLIAMIENEFPRPEFPEAYLGLLAIHKGQILSLMQQDQRRHQERRDLLNISVTKGGASVLANGYLVAGRLDPSEVDFCFGLGVVLQLADDIQDLREDIRAGRRTLFTLNAGRGPLDATTNRLMRFVDEVLTPPRALPFDSRQALLRDLLRRNSLNLVLQSVAQSPRFYSRPYLRRMEAYSPLGFAFITQCAASLPNRFRGIGRGLGRRYLGRGRSSEN